MKVSIGSKIIDGPWGGGNLFVSNLSSYLKELGHEVIFNLSDRDIDIILLTDPRSRKESTSTFNHLEIQKYKKLVNNNVVVIQRINECDERKGTVNINKFYLEVSNTADHVIFVSSWLENIYLNLGLNKNKSSVILAGADEKIFNFDKNIEPKKPKQYKLVTHHWSSHKNKGFETYDLIDKLISSEKWKEKIEFTYIGNISNEYKFQNIKLIDPLAGKNLAEELKRHHIYVTGSVNEPSGNHHIEAAQCGLPILYINSGGIPEYCEGFGIEFNENFEERLEDMINNYNYYKTKLAKYPRSSTKMCNEYYHLFEKLMIEQKPYKSKFSFQKELFLIKQKFYKHFRDNYYFSLKKFTSQKLKKFLVKNG